jgi:prophage DNA circulation protein
MPSLLGAWTFAKFSFIVISVSTPKKSGKKNMENTMTDDTEIRELEKKLQDCVIRMRALAPMVGAARQIKEFSSDQRKNALAGEQVRFIQRGESVSAAENLARSSPTYITTFKDLERSYADACGTIAEWEAVFARFEACRSMLAMQRVIADKIGVE